MFEFIIGLGKMVYVFDRDGVLAPYVPGMMAEAFGPEAVQGIELLRRNHDIVFSSGKSVGNLYQCAMLSGFPRDFYLNGFWLVGENGATAAYANGRGFEKYALAKQENYMEVKEALRKKILNNASDARGWKRLNFGTSELYVREEDKDIITTLLFSADDIASASRYLQESVQQIVHANGSVPKLFSGIKEYSDRGRRAHIGYIDIILQKSDGTPEHDKIDGVAFVSSNVGVLLEDVYAAGDSPNDHGTLRGVGNPRAVGNADYVTKKIVDDNPKGIVAKRHEAAGVLEIAMHDQYF